MIARFTGATLGLLAFTVAVVGGLWVGNPVVVTLSRAIWSLAIFCILGLLIGAAAQAVVNDRARRRLDALRGEAESRERTDEAGGAAPGAAMAAGAGGTAR